MNIGIVSAMEEELAAIAPKIAEAEEGVVGRFPIVSGVYGANRVTAICCGIGIVNAAMAARALIEHFGVDVVINPGVAGALSPSLKVCDVVVSSDSIYWDFEMQILKNHMPHLEGGAFPADEHLIRLALSAARKVLPDESVLLGRFASGQLFMSDLEQKLEVNRLTGAVCVDMEGAGIAHACHMSSTPYVIVRAISDRLMDHGESSTAAFDMNLESSADIAGRVTVKLLEIMPDKLEAVGTAR